MKLGPAQHRRESKKQQHRVQQNEPRNRRIRVLKQHHQRHKPDRRTAKVQLLGRIVGEGHAEGAEGGVEEPHEGVVDVLGVFLARLEFEGAVVAGQVAGETDEHLSERWVHVEVEFAFEVVGAEFAEAGKREGAMLAVVLCGRKNGGWDGRERFGGDGLGFVPGHDVGESYPPCSSEEGEKSEDHGCDYEFPLVESLQEGLFWLLDLGNVRFAARSG